MAGLFIPLDNPRIPPGISLKAPLVVPEWHERLIVLRGEASKAFFNHSSIRSHTMFEQAFNFEFANGDEIKESQEGFLDGELLSAVGGYSFDDKVREALVG